MVYIVQGLLYYYKDYTMITKSKPKNYNPCRSIVEGLNEILQYEKMKYEKKMNGIKLSSAQIKEGKRVNKIKFEVITRVFLSVANLLYFFEFIAKGEQHVLVREVFEKDIMGLFGAKPVSNRIFHMRNDSLIVSLIDATLLYRKFQPSNFRMLLLEYMQYTVSQAISLMSISELNDEISSNIVSQDMGRALAWVRLFAQKANSANHKTHKKP